MSPRFFEREPETVHDTSFLRGLTEQLFEFLSKFHTERVVADYRINVDIEIPTSVDFKSLNKISEVLHSIFIPAWSYYHRSTAEPQEIPLYTTLKRSINQWHLPIVWSPYKIHEYKDELAGRISAEIKAILTLPEDINWSERTDLRLNVEVKKPWKESYEYKTRVEKVPEKCVFKFPEGKQELEDWYSQPLVKNTFHMMTEGRWLRIKRWLGAKIKVKVQMWENYEKQIPLQTKNPDDVPRLVTQKDMISGFTSIDRIGADYPDLLVLDFDISSMLLWLNPEESFKIAYDLVKDHAIFLNDYGIRYFLHFTGGRGFHFWMGQRFSEPPSIFTDTLKKLGVKDERLYSLYGFNSLVAPIIGTKILRNKVKTLPENEKRRILKRVSFDSYDKSVRYYKVLEESLGRKKNAVRLPLTYHESTGLLDCRVAGWYGGYPRSFIPIEKIENYQELKTYCRPENVLRTTKKYPEMYSVLAPENNIGEFEHMLSDLKNELVAVLYCSNLDPNKKIDDALFIPDYEIKELRRMYKLN